MDTAVIDYPGTVIGGSCQYIFQIHQLDPLVIGGQSQGAVPLVGIQPPVQMGDFIQIGGFKTAVCIIFECLSIIYSVSTPPISAPEPLVTNDATRLRKVGLYL
jgi:hypothetical protein